nr:hypothetical protein [Tanacetum cinerariifolium]
MTPKKRTTRSSPATTTTTTTPVTNAQLKALVDQGVANALAARDSDISMNGDDSHNSGMGVRRQAPLARKCTYPDFMKCKPLYFKGTKGVVELIQWTIGYDVDYAMTWINLKKMMTDNTLVECQTENKRKLDNNNQAQQQLPKKQGEAIGYIAGPDERKEYARTLPLCKKCKFHHNGQCTVNNSGRRITDLWGWTMGNVPSSG